MVQKVKKRKLNLILTKIASKILSRAFLENPDEEGIKRCKKYLEKNTKFYARQLRDFFQRKLLKLPTERDVDNCLRFLEKCEKFEIYDEWQDTERTQAYSRKKSIFVFYNDKSYIVDHAIQLAILRKNMG